MAGAENSNSGNIDSFLNLIINIGKIVIKRNKKFIEQEPTNENACINTSSDEKKCPGINQGNFNNFPLKYSKIDKTKIVLMGISPIFGEISFAVMKARLQVRDKNNGSNVATI